MMARFFTVSWASCGSVASEKSFRFKAMALANVFFATSETTRYGLSEPSRT